jgi:hypothetical protein
LLIVNIAGVFVYVSRASHGWVIPEEQGMIPIVGEPYVWFAAIAPVVALFVVVNAAWTWLIIARGQRRQRLFLVLTAAVWLIGIGIDFAHH